jgi:hypothetical protein
MPVNIAARRGAKNQRRKAVVAQKRKAEMDAGTTAGQARLAQNDPIQHCLLSEGLFDVGMGTLVLTRGATPSHVTAAVFLLDAWSLGVKDVYKRSLSGKEFEFYLEQMSIATPMVPVDPAFARKLLHDLVAWSRAHGFAPHRDYPKIEPIFGSISTVQCDVEFQFGHVWSSVVEDETADIARLPSEHDEVVTS